MASSNYRKRKTTSRSPKKKPTQNSTLSFLMVLALVGVGSFLLGRNGAALSNKEGWKNFISATKSASPEGSTEIKLTEKNNTEVPNIVTEKPIQKSEETHTKATTSEVPKETLMPTQTTTKQEAKDTIRFFYFRATETDYEIVYVDKAINFKNSSEFNKQIEKGFKTLINEEDYGKTIEDDVVIRKIEKKGDIVTIDFSKSLYQANQGSGSEVFMLDCIASTLGYYYDVKKVRILVEGKPYSSGHLDYGSNDYFTPKYDMAKPLNTQS